MVFGGGGGNIWRGVVTIHMFGGIGDLLDCWVGGGLLDLGGAGVARRLLLIQFECGLCLVEFEGRWGAIKCEVWKGVKARLGGCF